MLRVLSVRHEIPQQVGIRGTRNRRTEVLVSLHQVNQIREPRVVPVALDRIVISGEDWAGSENVGTTAEDNTRETGKTELDEHDNETGRRRMNAVQRELKVEQVP